MYNFFDTSPVMDLVKLDYIVAMINQKVCENVEDEKKVEILTEVLNDIKLVLVDGESQEVH